MRDARPARGLFCALVLGLSGCDSTVGLDSTKLSFSRVLVPGACPAPDSPNLQFVDFSVMLLDDENALLPGDKVAGETGTVGDQLSAQGSFRFVAEPVGVDPGELAGKQGIAESDPQNAADIRRPVGMGLEGLEFLYSGGEARADDDHLVVILMDHSSSLIGQDPITQRLEPLQWASDLDEQRIVFFSELIGSLDEENELDDTYVSLVPFSGTFPDFTSISAQPSRNRDITLTGNDEGIGGLDDLESGQNGGTPLADALDQSLSRIIDHPPNADLNPVVIVFTDGTEGGDTSTANLDQVTEKYVAHRNAAGESAPVPVIVIHLQPSELAGEDPLNWPRGRNAKYAALACRTGGEYIFLRNANEFTANSDLATIVRNRIRGTWRLRAQTELGKADFTTGGYLLTSELSATLGDNTFSAPMALFKDASGRDTRLWFHKP